METRLTPAWPQTAPSQGLRSLGLVEPNTNSCMVDLEVTPAGGLMRVLIVPDHQI